MTFSLWVSFKLYPKKKEILLIYEKNYEHLIQHEKLSLIQKFKSPYFVRYLFDLKDIGHLINIPTRVRYKRNTLFSKFEIFIFPGNKVWNTPWLLIRYGLEEIFELLSASLRRYHFYICNQWWLIINFGIWFGFAWCWPLGRSLMQTFGNYICKWVDVRWSEYCGCSTSPAYVIIYDSCSNWSHNYSFDGLFKT